MQTNRLYAAERRALNSVICQDPALGGNDKTLTLGQCINRIAEHISQFGFSLDMVSGDVLLGQKGSRILRFRRTHQDSFGEHPEIENSGVSFNWENLTGDQFNPRWEVVAYVS